MGDLLQKPEQRKPPTALDAGPSRHAIVMRRRLRAELADGYGWDRPLSVIPHGTDAVRFRPARDKVERAEARARCGLGEEGRTPLFIGEAVKGLRQAIAQMPMFPQVHLLVLTRLWRSKWAAWRCDFADMPCSRLVGTWTRWRRSSSRSRWIPTRAAPKRNRDGLGSRPGAVVTSRSRIGAGSSRRWRPEACVRRSVEGGGPRRRPPLKRMAATRSWQRIPRRMSGAPTRSRWRCTPCAHNRARDGDPTKATSRRS